MKAIAIIAHGSRSSTANTEFLTLAEALRQQLKQYQLHDAGFLEIAEPNLMQCCQNLIEAGASSIDIYPLFFNRGKHVADDIPALVSKLEIAQANIRFKILPYFGSNAAMADAVASHISATEANLRHTD